MEKKNSFMPLLIYSIKEKRNWVILSTVIIFITTIIIPYILRADQDNFIIFGIIELVILVFINSLVDNNFLHNESKLTYYRSKPLTLRSQILINIVTNALFTVYLSLLIVASALLQNVDYETLQIFKTLIPWLTAIILLASLSSILSGNTLMAAAMTVFNFCLPLIVLLITMFVFTILENAVIGFSADVLNDYFINNIYKLDYLYFVRYINYTPIDLAYLVLFPTIMIFISFLIDKLIKRRKNENMGLIVFSGFKYFVAVLACLIIPALFSISLRYTYMVNKLIISALLAALSYYIIIAFIEKSFRISKSSIKVFLISMLVFTALIGSTVTVANQYKSVIPNPEDVKYAYVGNQTRSVDAASGFLKDKYSGESFSEWKKSRNVVIYEENQIIRDITELHKELLKDQTFHKTDYYGTGNLVIAYWMKDGSTMMRSYKLTPKDVLTQEIQAKNAISNKILNSYDFKKQRFYYLYDNEYYEGRNLYVNVRNINDYNTLYEDIKLDDVREVLVKDIDNLQLSKESAFSDLFLSGLYYSKEYMLNEPGYLLEIYERLSNNDEKYLDEIYTDKDFENILNFFN